MKLPPYERKDMSEALLQRHLRTWKSDAVYVGQNFYMFEWESDFVCKVRSGFWHEVECKISLADFKADFRKTEKHTILQRGERFISIKKVVYHMEGSTRVKQWQECGTWKPVKRPNYFSYCVPWYLQEKVEPLIPEYAGLIVMDEYGQLRDVRKAKLLHNEKYKDEQFRLTEKFYYHWLHLQQNVERNNLSERIKELKATVSWLKAEYKAATGYSIEDTL